MGVTLPSLAPGSGITLGVVIAALAWLGASATVAADEPRTAGPDGIQLPAGPLADAWNRLAANATDMPPGHAADPLGADAWTQPATWDRWAEVVHALGAGGSGDPTAPHPPPQDPTDATAVAGRGPLFAHLARLALAHGRWNDAWAHFERALGEADAEPRALMASFLPGAGAQRAPFADGVLLRPAIPPPSPDARPGFADRREAWVRGLVVGAATLDLRIGVEPEGVQIDLEHVSGGTAHVRVSLPEPEGLELRVEYVDWLRQDTLGEPLEVVVAPGDERHSIYARARPRPLAWPTGRPTTMPAALAVGGLTLVAPASDPGRARLDAVARAVTAILDVPCTVRVRGAPTTGREPAVGVELDVLTGAERERKLAWLASAVEGFALRPRSTAGR